ncbi:MAG: DUF1246 domain-containing protein, partial [Sulfolobales archaeon]|nr:DUF1246 domain-containing protein [Sulfolobales archaeon]
MDIPVREVLEDYELDKLTVATLASHSSLQIVHGAKREGLRTLLVVTESKAWFYKQFSHLVNSVILVRRWGELCREDVVGFLRKHSSILVPHGSFVEYVGLDCALGVEVP